MGEREWQRRFGPATDSETKGQIPLSSVTASAASLYDARLSSGHNRKKDRPCDREELLLPLGGTPFLHSVRVNRQESPLLS